MIKEITLYTTDECNWRCSYCDVIQSMGFLGENYVMMNMYMPLISEWAEGQVDDFCITGGEPGLLSERYISVLLNYLTNFKVTVSTNGTWFTKGFHKKYNIEKYNYHFAPEIYKNTKVRLAPKGLNVVYRFVIHNSNFKDSMAFMRRNPKITFEPRIMVVKKENLEHYHMDERQIEGICEVENITDKTRKEVESFLRLQKHSDLVRDVCNIEMSQPQIDLVHGTIQKCCISYSNNDGAVLCARNIADLLDGRLKFNRSYICEWCYNCYSRINEQSIKEFLGGKI